MERMENIRLVKTRNMRNGWVVIADTKRFGKDEIMFEGTYDECNTYLKKQFLNPKIEQYKYTITGNDDGVYFDNDWVILHRNGFIEQDWSKFGF